MRDFCACERKRKREITRKRKRKACLKAACMPRPGYTSPYIFSKKKDKKFRKLFLSCKVVRPSFESNLGTVDLIE